MLEGAPVQLRPDLVAACAAAWAHLGSPGTCWPGATRIAIAAEARHAVGCAACATSRKALSPSVAPGEHDATGNTKLSDALVDVIHRVVTDQGRLTRAWFDGATSGDLGVEQYVETIGVIAHVTAVDTLHRALGLLPPALPDAIDGAPSNTFPPEAAARFSWVPTVSTKAATGTLAANWFPDGNDTYVPRVMQALSCVPPEAIAYRRLSEVMYLDGEALMDFSKARSLSRPQTELIATRVSALNECFY